jgi:hypothetical protein
LFSNNIYYVYSKPCSNYNLGKKMHWLMSVLLMIKFMTSYYTPSDVDKMFVTCFCLFLFLFCLFVWVFFCIAARAVFHLNVGCHHYRWQCCRFRHMLSILSFSRNDSSTIYTASSDGPSSTSQSEIQTGDVKAIRSLRRRSNHWVTRVTLWHCA